MNNNDNQLYHSLMLGDFSGEGDLIQLITDEDDETSIKEENYANEIRYCFRVWSSQSLLVDSGQ